MKHHKFTIHLDKVPIEISGIDKIRLLSGAKLFVTLCPSMEFITDSDGSVNSVDVKEQRAGVVITKNPRFIKLANSKVIKGAEKSKPLYKHWLHD